MSPRLFAKLRIFSVLSAVFALSHSAIAGPPPTARQALSLEPIQANVDYDQPADTDQCKVEKDTRDGNIAWVVVDASGSVLRHFSDTNGDNVVDQWCYYRIGLEVYRDIDSDFDGKADQYRWFHTAGTRWGLDKDENGKIDSWKQISPYEVAEVAVEAMKNRDAKLFGTLLPTSSEIGGLGLSDDLEEQIQASVSKANTTFAKFASSQSLVTSRTRFLDFGAARPAAVPAGTNGSKKDLLVYDNIAALVENNGTPEQVFLGALIQIGDSWRLVGLPQTGNASSVVSLFNIPSSNPAAAGMGQNPPTEAMQKLLAELDKLDARVGGDPKQQQADMGRRIEIMQQLAGLSSTASEREQWQRQLADMLSTSAQSLDFDQAIEELDKLASQIEKQKASKDLRAHVEFRRLWSEYIKAGSDPKADYTKIRDNWVESLEKFVKDYADVSDTAEALLQLGMEQEFAGEDQKAVDWYSTLAKKFPNSDAGKKGSGAIRRINSVGRTISLKGNAINGGQVDLAGYRRKYVLVHYWATWCEPCKQDIEQIKKLHAAYSRRGFDVIGVNLDSTVSQAQRYLASNRLPWKHLFDEGGLDGRLANEMGVMTLPLMLLVDNQGKVISRNVHLAELDDELKRVLKTPQVSRR